MRIIALTYQIYKFPLSSDFTNSKQKIVNKEVIILKAKDDLNNYHFGEVSPLIEFSEETILDCINGLDTLINRKIVLGNVDEIKNKLKRNEIYPSVKFGIEQVLLSIELRYNSKIYSHKFKFSQVNINGVVGIKPQNETIKRVNELVNKNFKTIKLKIGRNNFSEDLEIIKTISEKYCDKVKIRLDVNGKWTYNEAKENFKILSQFNLQFIEQPVKELNDLEKLSAEFGQIIVPDECVETFEDAVKIIDSDKFNFIVLKPAIRIGIFDTLKIISIANSKNINVIITSSFETIIGRSALIFLASITNHSFAHGLSTELLGADTINANLEVNKPKILSDLNNYPITFEFLQ